MIYNEVLLSPSLVDLRVTRKPRRKNVLPRLECHPILEYDMLLKLQPYEPVLLQARGDVVDAHTTIPLPQAPWQPA